MNSPSSTPKSTFVDVLAWISIALFCMSIFGGVMQNVMLNVMLPMMLEADAAKNGQEVPFTLMRVASFAFLAFSVFGAYASYALLKRREWARKTFVALLWLGIVWSLVCGLGMVIAFALPGAAIGHHGEMPEDARAIFNVMLGIMTFFVAATCALYGWLIKKLTSAEIRAEFDSPLAI